MSHRRTLALFDLLLAKGELPRMAQTLVLPMVHDALGPEEDLLRSLAGSFDGTFIDTQGRSPGADGPLNAPLLRVVKLAFERERLPITVDESTGRIVATFDDHPSPSGGLETALRLVEVLVSAEINRPIALVSYTQSGLDSGLARLLWSVCGLVVADHPPDQLRLFAPIASGDIDAERHCLPNNPVRLAVQQNRLIQRGDAHDLDDALRGLLLSRDQPLVLFLGAGASASAGVRMGDSIRDEALRNLIGPHPTLDQRIDAFRTYLDGKDRWRQGEKELTRSQFVSRLTLERVLREEFHRLGGRSRDLLPVVQRITRECETALSRTPTGRLALRSIIDKLPRLVVATVNFDRLVEDGLVTPYQTVITPQAFEEYRDLIAARIQGKTDVLPILKLHGSIEDSRTLVADIDKTELGLPNQIAATLDALVAAKAPLTWAWIGCSMRDADLALWLRNKDGVDDLNEWWIDPLPSESLFEYARYVREPDWARVRQRLRDRLITETADIFLERLDQHIDSLPAL